MKVLVDFNQLADIDDPIRSLEEAAAALVCIHAQVSEAELAGKAMGFMCNKISDDVAELRELYDGLGKRPTPAAVEESADEGLET